MGEGDDDCPHRQRRHGRVDCVVGLDVADFLDSGTEDTLGSPVDKRTQAADRHVLDIAVAIVECVDEAVDDPRAGGVVMGKEGGSTGLEHAMEVIEGHVPNVRVRVVEFGQ